MIPFLTEMMHLIAAGLVLASGAIAMTKISQRQAAKALVIARRTV
ncbi:hypothetical protein [Primorskyibacter marinus]|nr:hypothetical protein [Primorskyibacter marinus]